MGGVGFMRGRGALVEISVVEEVGRPRQMDDHQARSQMVDRVQYSASQCTVGGRSGFKVMVQVHRYRSEPDRHQRR
jgi:hypothetical protein